MKACLYRQYNADGALLYVGIANSVVARLNGHRHHASWLDQIARIDIQWFETRDEASEAERAAIQAESPRYNKLLYPPRRLRPERAERATPTRKALKLKMERAGFQHVSGWLPIDEARHVARLIEAHRSQIEAVAAEPPLPRGRPPKSP